MSEKSNNEKAITFGQWICNCGWKSHPTEEDIWLAAGEHLTTEELFEVFERDMKKKKKIKH